MTHEEKLLIDRYLENSLTGIELKGFLDRLESDDVFKKEVSFRNRLIEGIQFSEYNRQYNLVKESVAFKRSTVPFALKLIFLFLLITCGGIVLWNYIDPGSTGAKRNYFSLDIFRNPNKDSINAQITENNYSKIKKQSLQPLTISASENSTVKPEPLSEVNAMNQTDTGEIIVKKDQLLIGISLKAINLGDAVVKDNNTDGSITKSTVDKLNPSGGLPDNIAEKSNIYNIEFWVSPVNYKGYKLVNDKLILFGIEEPDAVQLYSKENKLWMKYGLEYYDLVPTEDFEALVKINEIPSALK